MRRLAAIVSLFFAVLVAAAAHADDMTLRWDDCGASGAALKTFACDTNVGASELVLSFVLSAPRSLTGIEASLQVLYPSSGSVPSWWDVPACRASTVFGLDVSPGLGTCESPWAPSAAGGVIFEPTYYSSTIGRLRAAEGVPPADSASLVAGVEYAALRIRISYAKTTGTGACAGCSQPAGIFLRELDLYNAVDPQPLSIFPSLPNDHRYFVGWQCEGSPQFDHGFVYDWTFIDCPTAAKRPTWGAIKGLYR